jgi:hypothetical protein
MDHHVIVAFYSDNGVILRCIGNSGIIRELIGYR